MQAIFEECETNAKTVPIVTRPNGLSKTQNVLDCIHISFIVKRFFLKLDCEEEKHLQTIYRNRKGRQQFLWLLGRYRWSLWSIIKWPHLLRVVNNTVNSIWSLLRKIYLQSRKQRSRKVLASFLVKTRTLKLSATWDPNFGSSPLPSSIERYHWSRSILDAWWMLSSEPCLATSHGYLHSLTSLCLL